jgi:hypothetical protein
VGKNIAESGNLFPVGIRVPFPEIGREIFNRISDHLKIPDNSIPASAILGKFLKGYAPGILIDFRLVYQNQEDEKNPSGFFDVANRLEDIIEKLERCPMHRRPRR